ncbi:MAG: dTDP-4-dehydrorhamnose 3,5-epimerase family protein [Actinomycetota bacterium]
MAEVVAHDAIAGVCIVTPAVHADARGLFVETFRREWIPGSGEMIQSNRADRRAGSIVGLHYHQQQADYWYVPFGSVRVVLHDLRVDSPTEGATLAFDLGARADGSHDHRGVYIPRGVGHGFAARTDATLTYLVDRYYDPADELGVIWDDVDVAADWGVTNPTLSDRDRALPKRNELDAASRPTWMARRSYWSGPHATGRGGR